MRWLLPPILFLACVASMALLHLAAPVRAVVPEPYRWLGLPVLLAGLGVAQWHARLFRRRGTNIKTFDAPDRLVTEGLFRRTRNPMYLGFALALLGGAILLTSLSPCAVVVAFVLIVDRWYIAFEEAAMTRTFGDDYRRYQRRVRRWI
jgi:protein-S-isoprenylcysteine O-methyltransferase Ste14